MLNNPEIQREILFAHALKAPSKKRPRWSKYPEKEKPTMYCQEGTFSKASTYTNGSGHHLAIIHAPMHM